MIKLCKNIHLMHQFRQALSQDGEPDLTIIDNIIATQEWQSLKQQGKQQIRDLENKLLAHLEHTGQQMLKHAPDIDLNGISHLMNRPAWQFTHSTAKREIEFQVETLLQEMVDELNKAGKHSSAFRRVNLFKDYMDDDKFKRLCEKKDKLKNKKKAFDDYVNTSINQVKRYMEKGQFGPAERKLKYLQQEAGTDNERLKQFSQEFQEKHHRFRQKIKQIKAFVKANNFDAAIEDASLLQNRYPDYIKLSMFKKLFQMAIHKHILQQSLDTEQSANVMDACRFLKAQIDRYGQWCNLTHFIETQHQAFMLFQRYLDALEQHICSHVLNLQFHEAIQMIDLHDANQQLSTLLKSSAYLPLKRPMQHYIQYETDENLQQKIQMMTTIYQHTKEQSEMPNDCPFIKQYNSFKVLEQKWQNFLNAHPSTVAEIEAVISQLQVIKDADKGDIGEKAHHKMDQLSQKRITAKATELWQMMAQKIDVPPQKLEQQLYRIEKQEFERAFQQMKHLYRNQKHSQTIGKYVKVMETEIAARGKNDIIIKKQGDMLKECETCGVDEYSVIFYELKNALKQFPDYPPFTTRLQQISNQIETCLLFDYETCLEAKRFHAALAIHNDWETFLFSKDMAAVVQQNFGDDGSISHIESLIEQARAQSSIADNLLIRQQYDNVQPYIDQAFEICSDDPVAINAQEKLEAWETGMKWLRFIDTCVKDITPHNTLYLEKCHELIKKVTRLPINFYNLTAYGLQHASIAHYQSIIKKYIGMPEKLWLCVNHKNYYLFFSDTIKLGNPKEEAADIQIQAPGIKRNHGQIFRQKNGFVLKQEAGDCLVNGQSSHSQKLANNDMIKLGMNTHMTVTALSHGSLVIELKNPNQVHFDLNGGIIMMKNRLDLQGIEGGHIVCPGLDDRYQITYKQEKLWLNDQAIQLDVVNKVSTELVVQVLRMT